MDELLNGLNQAQREAATKTEGCVRVVAGAGSGKTRALAARFAYLVGEIGVLPGSILCVTFTNKSANEMRNRIRFVTGELDTGYIDTFHSFCVTVLQEDSYAVGYPKAFLVLDNADIDEMLKIVYEECGLSLRDRTFSDARDRIEILKCLERPDYYEDLIALPLSALEEKYQSSVTADDQIFYGYLYQQKKCFGLDYNDLIKFVLHIFETNETVRTKWQTRIEYVMVDEFQDIDALQYKLMQQLVGYHQNLFIVGDPDQTIYTWRGANVKYLLDFDKAFPKVQTVLMMENYRSTPEILSAANALIAKNRLRVEKNLIAKLPGGVKPRYYHGKTAADEANFIADEIEKLVAGGCEYRDVTVLYRAHYVSRTLEETFLARKLPYTLSSGTPFFARREIKDALSYLRLIVFRDDLAFLRVANVPKRNLGERRIRFLREQAEKDGTTLYAAMANNLDDPALRGTKAAQFHALIEKYAKLVDDLPASELLSKLLDESGYEALLRTEGSQVRLDNLAELKQAVYEFETTCGEERTLENFLLHTALLTNADTPGGRDAIKLMTVHAAKGLEFVNVFLCSMSEGVFPSKRVKTRESMEEERRLAFVAVTRAEARLYLSDAEGRSIDGSYRFPSRFLFDIGLDNLDCPEGLPESIMKEAGERIALSEQLLRSEFEAPRFQTGARVLHNIMGAGTVLSEDAAGGTVLVQFDDLPTPRKLGAFAKLKAL